MIRLNIIIARSLTTTRFFFYLFAGFNYIKCVLKKKKIWLIQIKAQKLASFLDGRANFIKIHISIKISIFMAGVFE